MGEEAKFQRPSNWAKQRTMSVPNGIYEDLAVQGQRRGLTASELLRQLLRCWKGGLPLPSRLGQDEPTATPEAPKPRRRTLQAATEVRHPLTVDIEPGALGARLASVPDAVAPGTREQLPDPDFDAELAAGKGEVPF